MRCIFWYDKECLGIKTKSKSKIVSTPKHFSYNDTNVNSHVNIKNLNESFKCRDRFSNKSLSFPVSTTCESKEQDFTTKL